MPVSWDQLAALNLTSASAYVKAVSTDQTRNSDSIYVQSGQSYTVLPLPGNFLVVSQNLIADVSWNQPGTGTLCTADFDVDVTQDDITYFFITLRPAPDGQRQVDISSPEFTAGLAITIKIGAHPTSQDPSGTISLFVSANITIVGSLDLVIQDSSAWDIRSQVLTLEVDMSEEWPTGASCLVQTQAPDQIWSAPFKSQGFIPDGNTAVATVTSIKSPYPIAVQAAVQLNGNVGPSSSPWTFPAGAAGGLPAPAPTYNFSDAALNVQWALVPCTNSVAVQLQDIVTGFTRLQTIQSPSTFATFRSEDFPPDGFVPGTMLKLTCVSQATSITGGESSSTDIQVPSNIGQWLPQYASLCNTTEAGIYSNVAFAQPEDSQVFVFFSGYDHTIEGAKFDASAPAGSQWTSFQVCAADDACRPSQFGSCRVTAFTLIQNCAEVLWLSADGSICGKKYSNGQWGSCQKYPQLGPATTSNGGRIVSSVALSRAQLFWVDQSGQISSSGKDWTDGPWDNASSLPMTAPVDVVPGELRAAGIVTDEGTAESHL